MRFAIADDMWHMGQKYWCYGGYSIGTPVLGMCLNISTIGNVSARYELRIPLVHVDNIQGNGDTQVTIDDNVIITGNLTTTGTITASNSNPFYLAGRVASNGSSLGSKGKICFSASRSSVGVYVVTPNTAVGNTYYSVSLTCQVDSVNGFARLNGNVLTASSFTVVTYINSVSLQILFSILQ